MVKHRQKTQQSVERLAPRRKRLKTPQPEEVDGAARPDHNHAQADGAASRSLTPPAQLESDQLVVDEVGSRWLRIAWRISEKTLERANSAMGREIHTATRVLKLYSNEQDEAVPRSKALIETVPIPDEADEWFLRVSSARAAWSVELGLISAKKRFFSLLHSTPVVLKSARPARTRTERSLADSTLFDTLDGRTPPPLSVQGAFVLNGTTDPRATLTIDEFEVPVDGVSGRFEWHLPLLNGREVVPILVCAETGRTQRALLAVEVNLHLLDPEPDRDD